MKTILQKLIKGYYWLVSPWLGTRCRFVPSCSEFANQALEQHGVIQGSLLTAKRICRCHPWGGSGYDPVPTKSDSTIDQTERASQSSDTQH